ncbi:MAG: folate/biopterin family MFS transporter [Microcoleus sp. PH2017_29_MFU_D_A]|uniref:folate/biopterin family MFS transporter n=1 Tax=unclassified Microcoleus TaxID=2642155 RepID=UPI001E00661D|nr:MULTISPECIES: folate/biopterin family MFS transporter [unclassified Microcoleus]MCC3492817.1 folate/biopterin family MFS transporter [Microcoleus sp. PH2017_16_JOR_D_A]MCC3583797.1 folate/biopterin family MFS transporter [Microcoleus sp. PH2017_30_WIL_O_A]MCC3593046.1 folate/biopterin family MFS transporter [Microcoleus sp. PH2017_28_MFU_U_A]MCC3602946.1 folate/biopterin family MFS transporter [Microcoleus sp. PH2017_29_MFU_D_A]MCC3634153.1 folate/biopterin family MFS transporter [Microcole
MLLSPSGASKLKESLKEKVFFGNEPTPELIAILLIYFVQGILGLARLAVSFFLKDELGMTPAEVSAMLGVVAIPWIIKPLFGFMSDGLPIFGYRRRPYIVLSGLLGTAAWVGMATVVHTPLAATGAIALSSVSLAVSDVIADSLVVERARKETVSDAGSLQSLSWGASAIGGLITAYLSGSLLQHFSTHTIFLITASFPLIVSTTAWLITEEKVNKRTDFETVKDQLKQLRQAVAQKTIWLPTAFLFLWQSTPSSDSAFFFFSTNELGFQPEFLGRVRLVTSIAALVGIWLFQRYLKAIPFRVIFGWSTVIASALGMTTLLLVTHANRALGIDDQWFSIGDSLILTVIGQIAYMPVLVLSARLCPPGVEATLFAVLMSVTNLAGIISYEGGAILTHWLGITDRNFDNLWLLVVIANLSTLLPLPFLNWLPAESTESGDPNYQQSLPVLEPELGCAKPGGQHFMPEYFPDLVPTSIPETRTVESK